MIYLLKKTATVLKRKQKVLLSHVKRLSKPSWVVSKLAAGDTVELLQPIEFIAKGQRLSLGLLNQALRDSLKPLLTNSLY